MNIFKEIKTYLAWRKQEKIARLKEDLRILKALCPSFPPLSEFQKMGTMEAIYDVGRAIYNSCNKQEIELNIQRRKDIIKELSKLANSEEMVKITTDLLKE